MAEDRRNSELLRDSWFQGSNGDWVRKYSENRRPIDVGRPPPSYYRSNNDHKIRGTTFTFKQVGDLYYNLF